jgi:hypothetical protein
MDFFERYEKKITEPYAIKVLSMSFDSKFNEYMSPSNPDNFDYISPDGQSALEVTIAISQNEKEAYIFEKLTAKGKKELDETKVKELVLNDNGEIRSYYGGTIAEIIKTIRYSIIKKHNKALEHIKKNPISELDLCVIINDGGILDKTSFEWYFNDLNIFVFDNIFFITPSYFIRYGKNAGFKEYPLIK